MHKAVKQQVGEGRTLSHAQANRKLAAPADCTVKCTVVLEPCRVATAMHHQTGKSWLSLPELSLVSGFAALTLLLE